ncbi:MAG: hypothetical protein C4327_13815, partial [Meiothermus sp.]
MASPRCWRSAKRPRVSASRARRPAFASTTNRNSTMRLLSRRHLPDETIVALLDGELTPEERTAAEQHFVACARCAD